MKKIAAPRRLRAIPVKKLRRNAQVLFIRSAFFVVFSSVLPRIQRGAAIFTRASSSRWAVLLFLGLTGVSFAHGPAIRAVTQQHLQQPNEIKLTLKPHATSLFWFHNVSKQNVLLDHEPLHPSASAGWGSLVHPNRWNVIVLQNYTKSTVQHFSVTCQNWQGNSITPLGCKGVVDYGQLQYKDLPKQLSNGEAWLLENKTKQQMLLILKNNQVKFPRSK